MFSLVASPENKLAREKLEAINIALNALIFDESAKSVVKCERTERGYKNAVLDCKNVVNQLLKTL